MRERRGSVVDRRSGKDRRKDIRFLYYFWNGGAEKRTWIERRVQSERRADWIRVGPWFSVCPWDPKYHTSIENN